MPPANNSKEIWQRVTRESEVLAKLGLWAGSDGQRMVNRLLSKGHSVTGYNRTRSKAEWLIKKG